MSQHVRTQLWPLVAVRALPGLRRRLAAAARRRRRRLLPRPAAHPVHPRALRHREPRRGYAVHGAGRQGAHHHGLGDDGRADGGERLRQQRDPAANRRKWSRCLGRWLFCNVLRGQFRHIHVQRLPPLRDPRECRRHRDLGDCRGFATRLRRQRRRSRPATSPTRCSSAGSPQGPATTSPATADVRQPTKSPKCRSPSTSIPSTDFRT